MSRVAGRHIIGACVNVMSGRVVFVFARPDCPVFWGRGREVVHIYVVGFPEDCQDERSALPLVTTICSW
jgi:hypothetical protein